MHKNYIYVNNSIGHETISKKKKHSAKQKPKHKNYNSHTTSFNILDMLKIRAVDDFDRLPFYSRSLGILCTAIDPHPGLTTFHTSQYSIEIEAKKSA